MKFSNFSNSGKIKFSNKMVEFSNSNNVVNLQNAFNNISRSAFLKIVQYCLPSLFPFISLHTITEQ
jgi:hypothetical protein